MKLASRLLVGIASILSVGFGAQPWQTLQDLTAAQIGARWQSPPPEYGPEPYYGLNGPVTTEQVRRDLDTMKRLGFQAVTIQAGYDMPFEYLSPEYFSFFRTFVQEAKSRNMRVWIVDDAGYPSGFAGGKFSSLKPELRMQALEVARQLSVIGGTVLHETVTPETVSAAAVDADGKAVPIPLNGNVLDWRAPPGKWTVLTVDHEFRTSPTRSDTNPKRVKDTTQSLEDYLDPAATAQFLAFTHEQYKRYVGDKFGKTIMGFRGDEPDYSISGLPWTPKFFDRFREIKGYDVRPYAALFAQTPSKRNPGVMIHLTPEQLRIKADYYDVFSQMFADGFFKPQADWCAANDLEYQVHLNHEEMQMELTRSEGDFFRDMRYVQVPGIDAIWHQIWTDTVSDYPRLASSVAHVYGRPRAFTESFAAYRPEPDLQMARYILNEQFVRGVNLVEMMYFPATSHGPRPPPSFMADAGFPALAMYVRRMSYLMSMGRPTASIALLLPSSSMWLGDAKTDTQFVSTERLLSENQIDFDIVGEDALARDLHAEHGGFRADSGNVYRTVILPGAEIISERLYDRLKTFAHGGGRVVLLGCTPSWIAGRNMKDARAAAPVDFTWAMVLSGVELPPTPTPPQYPPEKQPEELVVSTGVLAAITKSELRELRTNPHPQLRFMKRRWKDADLYLLFNEGAKPVRQNVAFAGGVNSIELWDPETGTISPKLAEPGNDGLSTTLEIGPYETNVWVVK